MDRVRSALARHARFAPAEMIDTIVSEVSSFAQGHPQQGDVTLVVIRRVEPAN